MPSRLMRRAYLGIGVIALLALLSAIAPAASALPREAPASPVARAVVTNGDAASIYGAYADADGHVCGFSVTAERTGTAKNPSTNLYTGFEMWNPDAYPCTDEYCNGWCGDHECDPPPDLQKGTCSFAAWYSNSIANSDFTVVGKTYRLKTSVDVLFEGFCDKGYCPEPRPNPVTISVPIDFTWERTSTRESTFSGIWTTRVPGGVSRSSGTTTYYSAVASGTFRGAEALRRPDDEGTFAEVALSHGTRVCRAPADQPDFCSK